jgi:hypothetical protein
VTLTLRVIYPVTSDPDADKACLEQMIQTLSITTSYKQFKA